MTQSIYATIVTKMGTQVFHVLSRKMHNLVSNKNGCQKFRGLALKDTKLWGYQKPKFKFWL